MELKRRRYFIKRAMEDLCVGGHACEWSVFSGGNLDSQEGAFSSFRLEDTLERITWSISGETRATSQIKEIQKSLPHARAQAEIGSDNTVDVEHQVLDLAGDPDLDAQHRRMLIDHLPASLRPVPLSLTSMERQAPPVTLLVDLIDSHIHSESMNSRIWLSDIVVSKELRGKGLGTATLTELCTYADLHGLPIEGKIQPGPLELAEALAPLARWYMRQGFTQHGREPDEWQRSGIINRAPLPVEGHVETS